MGWGQRVGLVRAAMWCLPKLELSRDAVRPLMAELAHLQHEASMTPVWDHLGAQWITEFQRASAHGGWGSAKGWTSSNAFRELPPALLRPWILADQLRTLSTFLRNC